MKLSEVSGSKHIHETENIVPEAPSGPSSQCQPKVTTLPISVAAKFWLFLNFV